MKYKEYSEISEKSNWQEKRLLKDKIYRHNQIKWLEDEHKRYWSMDDLDYVFMAESRRKDS